MGLLSLGRCRRGVLLEDLQWWMAIRQWQKWQTTAFSRVYWTWDSAIIDRQ